MSLGAFGQIQPSGSTAPTVANNIFNGRYLFRSELHTVGASTPFVEGGILYSDGNGRIFVSFTTYNNGSGSIISPNAAVTGSYSIDSQGFGTITMDWGSGSFAMTEHFFCLLSGDYCTIVSSEPGRSWQGKLWKDKSTYTVASLTGSYIFESDGALNQFAESGIITFGNGGAYTLASIYNVALHPELSNLQSPTPAFTCGITMLMNYYGQPAIFEATQGQCPSTVGMDAFALYCFFDGSMCILVPDQTGAGWIAEMRRQ